PPCAFDVILADFRERYRPKFLRGQSVYSEALGREVKPAEGCSGADRALLAKLAACKDAPKNRAGEVDALAVPKLFTVFARHAWREMLNALRTEQETAEVIESAEDEFRRAVTAALLDQASFGWDRKRGDEAEHVEQTIERNSLIDWAAKFAKP